jgi:PAS domain S-box-containing protein
VIEKYGRCPQFLPILGKGDGLMVKISRAKERELYEALVRKESELRVTLYSIGDGVISVDMDGLVILMNPVAEKLTGWEEQECRGMPLEEVFHIINEETRTKVENPVKRVLREGTVIGLANHTILIARDGTEHAIADCGSPIYDKEGRVTGVVLVFRDQTEKRKAEKAVAEAFAFAQSIIATVREPLVVLDAGLRILSANRVFYQVFGVMPEETEGRLLYELGDRQWDIPELRKLLEDILPQNTSFDDYVVEHDFPRIGQMTMLLNARRIYREANKTEMILLAIEDITERKQAEKEVVALQEQLRQSQKMEAIGRLAGGIAHDFNNLLTVIKGTCQLSLLDLREGDPLKKNLEEIKSASDRAADLTRQLLAFSRKQILEMRVLDLNTVIKNLEKMVRRIIGEDIELVTFLTEGIGRVRADPGQMEQAIINIVVNARDAMPGGGKLTIETANVELDEAYAKKHIAVQPGRYVMLSISDTGVGMTSEVKERVFEPFFTTKEMGKGTGLGLSTVYGIVKQSGGNIWVYSEPGKGTTFKIYLPRVDEPLEELKEEVIKEIPQGSETVLIVEDEEVVRKLAVRLLKKQGYKVLEASDGGKAFILCEEYNEPIHLILTDVVMPGMGGRDLVERLKEIHPEAKALYMSGYTDNVILHHGILEKGIVFIQKPFTLESLARKVREVLDK